MFVCQAGTSLTQPQSNSTVPPRLGSLTFSTPCPSSQLASSTIATQWAPVRLATGDRVGDVVGVAVGDRDVGRLDLLGGRHRDRVVGLQERVDQHGGLAVAQLEAGLAVELDLHLQRSPWGLRVRSSLRSVPSRRQLQPSSPSAPPRRAGRGRRRSARRGRARWRPSASRPRAARRTSRPRRGRRRAPSAAAARPGRRCARPRRSARVEQPLDRGVELARRSGHPGQPNRRGAGPRPRARRGRRRRRRPARRRRPRSGRRSAARSGPRRRRRRRSGRTPRRSPPWASARRIANQAATAPSAIPLPPAITAISPWASAIPLAASIPSEPQASSSSAGGDAAEPPLDARSRRSPGRPRRRTGSRRRRRRRAR